MITLLRVVGLLQGALRLGQMSSSSIKIAGVDVTHATIQ